MRLGPALHSVRGDLGDKPVRLWHSKDFVERTGVTQPVACKFEIDDRRRGLNG